MTPIALATLALFAAAAGYLCGRASAVRRLAELWADGYAAGRLDGREEGWREGYVGGARDAADAASSDPEINSAYEGGGR